MTIRTPFSACCRWIVRHPWGTLWLVAACVLPLTLVAGGLRPDNRLAVWFVEDDSALLTPKRFLVTMGRVGIPLDVATATIGTVVLGIAVDDSIHLLVRFRAERRRGREPRRAMTRALRGAGRAVVLSSLVLGA
jgi:uncharacterized membrane protein YdfJ with MMPL/SSD domain